MQDQPSGIEVSGVRRSFGQVHAVRDVSFRAEPGSVTALIGPNGSGKTTLMLMLATLLQPDAGSIRIDGHDPVVDTAIVRASMGWMPDVLGSWASLSSRVTLEITGRLYRMSKPDAARRAAEVIDLVGLDELADRPTRVLSRGQKQKLSLARALMHDPQVLLLDEPASGLDPAARVDLRILIRRLAGEGRTLLVSSHVLAELEEMADAAVYMSAGSTVAQSQVDEARAATQPWRIRAIDMVALDTALAARDGVSSDHLGRLVEVADEAEAAELLADLVTRGVQVTAFGPVAGDFERTFLELGRRSIAS
jgi:ABC-2 type transport system ATP-binding protein